jgi:hypothetical protein
VAAAAADLTPSTVPDDLATLEEETPKAAERQPTIFL